MASHKLRLGPLANSTLERAGSCRSPLATMGHALTAIARTPVKNPSSMEGIGAAIGIAGAALLIVGLCWLKFLAFSVSDFFYCGLCIAVGMAVGSLGSWIYQRARSRRVNSKHQ